MLNKQSFSQILDQWKKERFPHKNIRILAKEYKEKKFVTLMIKERASEELDVFLDFGGIFFWEYWKHNTPSEDDIKFLLFSVSNSEISPVTQYSIILALSSSYKNHDVYQKVIYNKLQSILNNGQEKLSENIIEQIYEAIY